MSLPWVKLHVSLLDNEDFKRFSDPAQHIYMKLLMLAGKQDRGDYGGRLDTATGPLKPSEIAAYFNYDKPTFSAALRQLAAAGFISKDLQKTIIIERFREKCAPREVIRARKNRDLPYERRTNAERTENAPEVEVEVEVDYDSLRSSALRFGEWPEGPLPLADLSRIFIERFANCRDPQKVKSLLGHYTTFLASMRRRNVTIAQAWSACEDCWRAGGEVPLFKATIHRAADFLPAFKPRTPEKGAVIPTVVNRQPDFVPSTLSAEEREQSLAAGAETLEKLRGQFGSEAVA